MSETGQDQASLGERRAGSGAMFDGIAERYDLLNRVISLGLDQGWRRRAVRSLELKPGATVLDLATGTADLAIAIARTHDVKVIGIDPSQGMLTVGRRKVEDAGLAGRVELEVGDAEQLRLGDASVDAISMAFGIRNVPDRARALREMARVTRPGGRVAILELSEPRGGIMSKLARFHIHTVVPYIGGAISGRDEYRYLQDSIARFPPPDEFAELMRGAGLRVLRVEPLTLGVVCLFVATPEGS
ncbi:bifunctional demethylmenaquinone methyltransferase/2-methoxy-6-polyprenyl-1,4-benzoquinol methylase UbiE [Sorangium sp. So ce1097]|uniref:bifunctional demethylmenaquinone methyltransferase/2-methoxy-6-polyprenyl-1,4-benzoquinol methylase UbiE n=1 Tax=Sorangium sp. So ce1097 TaxID=3133330 RepID=UPI003F632CAF